MKPFKQRAETIEHKRNQKITFYCNYFPFSSCHNSERRFSFPLNAYGLLENKSNHLRKPIKICLSCISELSFSNTVPRRYFLTNLLSLVSLLSKHLDYAWELSSSQFPLWQILLNEVAFLQDKRAGSFLSLQCFFLSFFLVSRVRKCWYLSSSSLPYR